MKLSKIAISLIAVVGVVQIGGAWYTGTQAEEYYENLIAEVNKEFKKAIPHDIKLKIQNQKFERHFFNSDFSYDLVLTTPEGETYKFKGQDKLNHGPLPLDRLVKGKLLPVMANIEGSLLAVENTQNIFKDNIALTSQMNVNYDRSYEGNLTINPAKTDNFETEKTTVVFDFDKNNIGDLNLKNQSITFNYPNSVKGTLKEIEYNATTVSDQYPNLELGDYVFNVKEFQLTSPEQEVFVIKDIKSIGKNRVDSEEYLGNADIEMDLVIQKNGISQDLGKMALNIDLKGNAEAWDIATEHFDDESSDNPLNDEYIIEAISKGLTFNINELSLKNGQGKSGLKLVLNADKFDPELVQSQQDILTILKQSALDVNLNIPAFQLMFKQKALLDKKTEQEANDFAKVAIEKLISDAKQSEIAIVDDKNINVKLAIDNGKVMLNERELSDQEIQQFLFILAFGLMSIPH
ncbi:Bacterial protein of uncharacterised function (DUF945) [Phocoenobacter uteri]|uniref:Bacterial protein of uncharacterized function (DUF945) n=1 Tax=Phocoenobacter uteri TaxID=146806 RepID=A0A379CA49_9PAST|nr:YdgA family protein [Phocoenobacter uteri]MDG6882454.1 hypothetical protein [Phocoenobacter uteri]SUB58615.1 Bacterial protein of uncharacterised function (DUF945) [Phocoenobacter uteri]